MRIMTEKIKELWENKPLPLILIIAFAVRLIAVVFSKGFGMYDDHFVIIETAQDWVNGTNNWFDRGNEILRNMVYPGINYLWFYFSDNILGLTDPQIKMFVVRLFHALFSLLIVSLSYKITLILSDKKNARQVAIILALFWPLAFFSVRNLVEVVCIPPILAGFYYILKNKKTKDISKYLFVAGIMAGLSMTIRYQMAIYIAGIGLVLLSQKDWKSLVWFAVGGLAITSVTMGIIEYFAWGVPFNSLYNFISYNLTNEYSYVTQPWYNFILLILGIFIPPVSFFFVVGFSRSYKKFALLFWPTFMFLIFHSYFANKQERFIIPLLPFVIILGVIGWNEYIKTSVFWERKKKLLKYSWNWFWIINTILLVLFTFTYGKKNRVESLYYLSKKDNISSIIWENNKGGLVEPPKFYLEKQIPIFRLPSSKSLEKLEVEINNRNVNFPNYIVFLGMTDIKKRVKEFETYFKNNLILETTIEPSLIDYILHKMNPKHNINQTSNIYRVGIRRHL